MQQQYTQETLQVKIEEEACRKSGIADLYTCKKKTFCQCATTIKVEDVPPSGLEPFLRLFPTRRKREKEKGKFFRTSHTRSRSLAQSF